MAEFVFKVLDIDEGGKSYDLLVRRAWLAETLAGSDVRPDAARPDGTLELTMHRSGQDILVRGRVVADLETDCGRCLEPAAVHVDAELTALMSPRSEGAAAATSEDSGEVELSPEDLDRETYAGEEIVLDPLVREQLLLEVPIQPLCQDSCPGIAIPDAVSGAGNDPAGGGIDPRLAPLLKLVGTPPTEE